MGKMSKPPTVFTQRNPRLGGAPAAWPPPLAVGRGVSAVPLDAPPLGGGGGPLPAHSPWQILSGYLCYPYGGIVVGAPPGGNKGLGTIHAQEVWANGLKLDMGGFLPVTGGTMTGALLLYGPPANALEAASKSYVDSTLSGLSSAYLPLAGGIMSGPLTFNGPISGVNRSILSTTAGSNRWKLSIGDGSIEIPYTGTNWNMGSSYVIDAYNDDGTFFKNALTIARSDCVPVFTAGVVRLGPQGTATGPAGIQLYAAPANGAYLAAFKNGKQRWGFTFAGSETETGTANAGADFSVSRYKDDGTFLDTVFTIPRTSGVLTLAYMPSIPGGVTGQVMSTNGSGGLSWTTVSGTFVDAPNDGQYYSRRNLGWTVSPGGLVDAPNDGALYARKSAAWAKPTHNDITDWAITLSPYAPLISPAFTGIPTAPTAGAGNNTTQIATTAFVTAALSGSFLSTSGGTMTGTLALTGAFTPQISITASGAAAGQLTINALSNLGSYISGQANSKSRWTIALADATAETGTGNVGSDFSISRYNDAGTLLDKPLVIARSTGLLVLLGDPTVALGAATKQYVDNKAAGIIPLMNGPGAAGMGITYSRADHVHPIDTTRAPVASPTFTGTVTIPAGAAISGYALLNSPNFVGTPSLPGATIGSTRPAGTSDTTLATTAFVQGAVASGLFLPLTGGILSGDLVIDGAAATKRFIQGSTAGITRWEINLGDVTPEGTGNAGSNFVINNYDNAGVLIGPALTIDRASGSTVYRGWVDAGTLSHGGIAVNFTASDITKDVDFGNGFILYNEGIYAHHIISACYSTATANTLTFRRARGTYALPALPIVNDVMGQVAFNAWIGPGASAFGGQVRLEARVLEPTPTATAMGSGLYFVACPMGKVAASFVSLLKYGELQLTTNTTTPSSQILSLQKSGTGYANIIYGYTGPIAAAALRWALNLGNATGEAGANVGSDFTLVRYSDTGVLLDTPLTITRSTGLVTLASLPSLPGGASGQVLSTNGSGVLSWASAGVVPIASSTTPIMDGVAAVGVGTTWARGDHVHPTDTSRYAASNPSNYQTDVQVAATYLPLTGGTVTGGNLTISSVAASTSLDLTRSSGQRGQIRVLDRATGKLRWTFIMGDETVEGGSNAGSNLSWWRHADDGTALGVVLGINRATGAVSFTYQPTIPGYATLAAPAFTGVPTAPTASVNTNTTQIATTAFVIGQAATVAPVMNGTAAVGVGLTFARADHVHASDTSRAPLASPTFTGVPSAPTAAPSTNTTQIATTAFVTAAVTTSVGGNYLPIAGGTLTGPLSISTGAGVANSLFGMTGASKRWQVDLGNTTAESGSNVGSDFVITPFTDAGVAKIGGLKIDRQNGDLWALSGSIQMYADTNPGACWLAMSKLGANMTNGIWAANNDLLRWQMYLGDATTETGTGNTGSNFSLQCANDAGTVIFTPISIVRATGVMTLSALPSIPGGAASGVLTTNGAGVLSWGAAVPLASSTTPVMNGTAAIGVGTTWARADHVHASDTTKANLASPTFTGVPAAPTASVGTSTTQLATTAFVAAGFLALTGGTLTGNLKTSVADGALGLLVAGPTKGIRFVTSTTGASIEGVDNTGVGSFQPLKLSGTTITMSAPLFTLAGAAGSAGLNIPHGAAPTTPSNGDMWTTSAGGLYVRINGATIGPLTGATDLSAYAPLASPTFTGVPLAPTAAPGTNTTQIATTAFVAAAVSTGVGAYLPLTGGTTTGSITIAPASGDSRLNLNGVSAGVQASIWGMRNGVRRWQVVVGDQTAESGSNAGSVFLVSRCNDAGTWLGDSISISRTNGVVTFEAIPVAPTAAPGTNTTALATTAFVQAGLNASVVSFNTRTGAVVLAAADITSAGGALLAGPAFTGVPTAPTAAVSTNTTQLATTAFVLGQAATAVSPMNGTAAVGTGLTFARQDHVHASDTSRLATTGGTVAGNLTINPGTLSVYGPSNCLNYFVKTASGFVSRLHGCMATTGNLRWTIDLGDNTAESGSNAGSNFSIFRYSDAGASLGSALTINRATGVATFGVMPSIPGGTSGYTLQTDGAGVLSWVATVQSVAGRTGAVTLTHNDITDWAATLAPYAPLASPTFTGTPTLPTGTIGVTQAPGDADTSLATTAFVAAGLALYLPLAGGTTTGQIISEAGSVMSTLYADASYPVFVTHRTRGTKAAPTINLVNDNTGSMHFYGYDGAAYRSTVSLQSFVIEPTPSTTAFGGKFSIFVTPLGTNAVSAVASFLSTGLVMQTATDVTLARDPTAVLHAATKQYVDAGDALQVTKAGDTMTGALSIAPATGGTLLSLKPTTGNAQIQIAPVATTALGDIWAYHGANARWLMRFLDNGETGSGNTGSAFGIYRYDDAGLLLGTAFSIVRASGAVAIPGILTVTGALSSGALTVTGTVGATSAISCNAANPTYSWRASGAQPVDQKNWDLYMDASGNLFLRALNDAYSASANLLTFNRNTGYTAPAVTFNYGALFGSTLAASTVDLTKHISLWSNNYGFSVTSGRMNIVAGSLFYVGGTGNDITSIASNGSITSSCYTDDTGYSTLTLRKARGGAMATPTIVALNDFCGNFNFQAYNGSAYTSVGGLRAKIIEPTPSATVMGSQVEVIGVPVGALAAQITQVFKYGEVQITTAVASPAGATLSLQKSAAGQGNIIRGHTGVISATSTRWELALGDSAAESGSNAGSNLNIRTYSDTGVLLTTPFSMARSTGVVTFAPAGSNGVTIAPAAGNSSTIVLNKPAAGLWSNIQAQTNGLLRWVMDLGEQTAEGGANAGSNFGIRSFNDAGTALATPLSIVRSTGVATFSQTIVNGSDRRWKAAIEPIKDALEIVEEMQGVRYIMKDDPSKEVRVGLLAQDVQQVLPEVIVEDVGGKATLFGTDYDNPLGIRYTDIIAVLIESVKTLSARVKELEAKSG
jgi:hypothetical protein